MAAAGVVAGRSFPLWLNGLLEFHRKYDTFVCSLE
jgi:hypothetical protein